jgi:outer membrane protein OmpA-like peptidoglycan-associated protein
MKSWSLSLREVVGLLACCFVILCTATTDATALTIVRYLDGVGDGSDVPVALLKVSAPTDTTLDNYDPSRDGFPGLWLHQHGSGPGETNKDKYQLWRIPAGGLTINGAVSMSIWTALKQFKLNGAGELVAYLVECNPDGTGCVQIASAAVTRTDWDVANTGTWIQDTFDFGIVNYTVNSGKSIGFKVIIGPASANELWLAYDTVAYPAWGQFTTLGAGITVTPTSGLTTTELGGTATFTVVLDSQPTANVTIGLSSSDLSEGTVSPASLTFTSGNWNTAQTVTVTGVDDLVPDGSVAYTIVTAAASSTDGNFNGMNASDVGVTNTDNETAGITVTPTSGLTTTEGGGTAAFTVMLDAQPTANVTIGLSSSNSSEGTVSPASLTFTPANWSVAQTVTVTGVDDFVADGSVAYTIVTAAASSADGSYNGLNAADVGVMNTDNDMLGITVSPTSGLGTTEGGGAAAFTVILASQPTANVTIGLSSSNPSEGTVSPDSLTFTPGNWNVGQTVTVTGVNDFVADGSVAYTIVTAAATSADSSYDGMDAADVGVTNADDDTAGITVIPTSGLTTTEAGGTAAFTMVLNTQPTANVTIGLSSSDLTEGTVAPASVTFTSGNWNTAQTVTVTGVNDFGVDGNVAYTIVTGAATSTDGSYNGRNAADVGVTNLDDDTSFAVDLRLSSDRDRVESGQPVRYTLEIRNRTSINMTNFEVQHELPPRFGYLPGTSMRDGRAIGDPSGSRVQRFALDTLAAFTDVNGDGQAGPGEPGYLTLSWVLVPGASATPGTYLDAAVASAGCSACWASNRAEASVHVSEDAFLARGTVVGRVFEDSNRDGLQGRDEKGLAGAVVMLDDGTSVRTDAEGRFHLPDLDPGSHVVKLDLTRFGLPATATTETAPVAYVSPGLLSAVRFGVSFQRDSVEIGRPPVSGLAIVTDELDRSASVAGNALRAALVVNGVAVRLRTVDARLSTGGLDEVLRLDGDHLREPAVFALDASDTSSVRDWTLDVRDQRGVVVLSMNGRGAPPQARPWDGIGSGMSRLQGGQVYEYQLRVTYEDGLEIRGPRRAFGVDRGTAIAMTMTGDSFEAGRALLTPAAVQGLAELAKALRRSPTEKVIVEGHTDSVGTAAGNLALSRARADAAVRYLVERERVPRSRLVVLAFGQGRPVASNATPEGRELNRRVEIHGQGTEVHRARLYDVYRGEASSQIGGLSAPVDSGGRFSCSVPLPPGDTLAVTLSDRRGRITRALVRLPRLEIVEPRGEVRVPYGGTAPGVSVGPRGAGRGLPQVAGLRAAPREEAAAHVLVSGRTDPGNRVEVDGVVVPVARAGEFSREVPVHVGENGIALVVRDPTGTLRVANLIVRVLDHAEEGQDLVVVDRIPNLTVALPPAASVLSNRELRLSGQTRPGHRVWANAESLHVDDDGAVSGTVTLPEGKSSLKIAVEDAEGHRGEIDRPVEVRSKRLFLVALADGVIGKTTGSALRGAGQSEDVWTEGRLAYHLKGWIAGRYLVTSAFDSRRRKFGDLFKDLDDAGRDRLLVNLDPDRLYPVYGDSSAIAYGAPGGGRFFLAVEGETFRASVGNFPISIDEVELAAFHRTLYGAQVRLGSPAGTPNPGASLTAFGAAARDVHVRDEIRATGGSLYYLSHRDILEGSIQVSIVVRDRDTGLPLMRFRQQRGADFSAKEIEGRLLFLRPIPSGWDDGSLVDGGQLYGQPVTIEAEYEARGSIEERAAVGGRFRQPIAPFLAVGGTLLQDEVRAGPYRLWSGDTEVKVGSHARIAGEVARSQGTAGGTFVSDDGGVSFADTDSALARRGDAWKVTADLDVGEWFHNPGRVKLGGFIRRSEPGFTGSNDPWGQGFARHGAQAALEAGRWGWWGARFNRERRLGIGLGDSSAVRDVDLFGIQWRRDVGLFGAASEFEQRTVDSVNADRTTQQTGAARLWWRPVRPIRTTAERQQTFSGPPNHRTSLGLEWWPLPSLALELKGSDGTTGQTLRGGVALTVAGNQFYLREERNEGLGKRTSSTLLGNQSALGSMGRTYSEYRWLHDGDETRTQSVVGLERGWRYDSGLLLRLSGEHSARDRSAGGGSRVALSSDLSYRGRLPIVATTRGEYRIDGAGGRERQVLTSTGLEWNLAAGVSARGDYRLSFTKDRVANTTPARYEERSFGIAFRPPRSDRVEGLTRWTLLRDRRLSAPGDTTPTETTLGVAALEATVRFLPGIDWVGKAAARIRGDARGVSGAAGETHSVLWAQRLEYTVRKPFRYGVEYRVLSQREVGDRSAGWVNELSWDPSLNFRLGLGYNFTSFSGDPLETGPESSHGWFLHGQSRY